MNSFLILPNLARFLGLLAFQVLVLKQMSTAVGSYFNILLYPLFILFLPMAAQTSILILLGFVMGISVDFFYDTLGVHASTGAFAGFARGVIMSGFEPKGGYSGKEFLISSHYFGQTRFLQIAAVFLFFTLLWYFSVEQFTVLYVGTILLKTLCAWALSMIFVILYGYLFNPKN